MNSELSEYRVVEDVTLNEAKVFLQETCLKFIGEIKDNKFAFVDEIVEQIVIQTLCIYNNKKKSNRKRRAT